MTQENKQLLLKDLCARLPYGVTMNVTEPGEDNVNFNCFLGPDIIKEISSETGHFKYIPYLRPMLSMTEEEAKEIAILHDIKDILSVKVTSDYIDVIVDDGVCSTETRTIWYNEIVSSIKCFDWLNAHHFDYRGLIEKGLALEAPEGLYLK